MTCNVDLTAWILLLRTKYTVHAMLRCTRMHLGAYVPQTKNTCCTSAQYAVRSTLLTAHQRMRTKRNLTRMYISRWQSHRKQIAARAVPELLYIYLTVLPALDIKTNPSPCAQGRRVLQYLGHSNCEIVRDNCCVLVIYPVVVLAERNSVTTRWQVVFVLLCLEGVKRYEIRRRSTRRKYQNLLVLVCLQNKNYRMMHGNLTRDYLIGTQYLASTRGMEHAKKKKRN